MSVVLLPLPALQHRSDLFSPHRRKRLRPASIRDDKAGQEAGAPPEGLEDEDEDAEEPAYEPGAEDEEELQDQGQVCKKRGAIAFSVDGLVCGQPARDIFSLLAETAELQGWLSEHRRAARWLNDARNACA